MPAASVSLDPAPRSTLLWRAKDSVTAVDDTRPPVTPVTSAPRALPSQRTATYPTSERLEIRITSSQSA